MKQPGKYDKGKYDKGDKILIGKYSGKSNYWNQSLTEHCYALFKQPLFKMSPELQPNETGPKWTKFGPNFFKDAVTTCTSYISLISISICKISVI